MKTTYSSLLCHGSKPHGLRHATLLGSVIYFQWNEPILRLICKKFIDQANVNDEETWQLLTSEGRQTLDESPTEQPVWSLDDDLDNIQDKTQKNTRNQQHDQLQNRDDRVAFVSHERIAWYSPAHYHLDSEIGEYGIHFDVPKVVAMGKSISESASESERVKHTPEDWVLAAFVVCIWHECCHAWVEELCSLAESITGKDYYTEASARYGFYIVMEEALCNTTAYGMSKFFWDGGTNNPEFSILLGSIKDWMRTQPPGYKDFSELGWHWTPLNDGFLRNMRRLLIEIYAIPEVVVAHVMRLYFDADKVIFPGLPEDAGRSARRSSRRTNLAVAQYIERYRYPTHTHPDLDSHLPRPYIEMRLEDRWNLLSFLRSLDVEALAQRARITRNTQWKDTAKLDCPFLGQLQEFDEFKSDQVHRFAEALIATALQLQEEDTVKVKPDWQERVVQVITQSIPKSNPKPDDFRPSAVFIALPGAEDQRGQTVSWERRRERIREILEQEGIPYGLLEEINDFSHIRIHPPELDRTEWQNQVLQLLRGDFPRADSKADTHHLGAVFIPLPGMPWQNGARFQGHACKDRIEHYLRQKHIAFDRVDAFGGDHGFAHLRIHPQTNEVND